MIRYIRQSEIKEWKTCRRAWYLSYGRNLTPASHKPDTSDLGTLVHGGLEVYYRDGQDPAEWVLAHRPEGEQFNQTVELARIMVEGYVEWVAEEGVDVGLRFEQAEELIEVEFGVYSGDTVVVQGRQDLVVYDEALGQRLLIDNKTVQTLDQAADMLPQNEQLLTYAVLRMLASDPIDGAIHNNLRRVKRTATAKPPFYGRERVNYNRTQLQNHWRHMHGTITDMVHVAQQLEAGADHQFLTPPSPSKDCSWRCPFFHACPMMDDGSNWEGFLSEFFVPKEIA